MFIELLKTEGQDINYRGNRNFFCLPFIIQTQVTTYCNMWQRSQLFKLQLMVLVTDSQNKTEHHAGQIFVNLPVIYPLAPTLTPSLSWTQLILSFMMASYFVSTFVITLLLLFKILSSSRDVEFFKGARNISLIFKS